MKTNTCYNTRLPDRDVIEREETCDTCRGAEVIYEDGQRIDCPACSGKGYIIVRT